MSALATRRERVILELEDQFTTGMARAAASTALLNKELNSLSRDSVQTRRATRDIGSGIDDMGRKSLRAEKDIDKLSGRLRIFADLAAVLGPSLIPVGAVVIPAITGLSAQLGFASIAAGTTVLAFQGMGDALEALNKAALDPTAENLRAAEIAMEGLTPAARDFATALRDLLPQARELRDAASEGFFPGATEGLKSLEDVLPRIEAIITSVSTEMGRIAEDAGESLSSDRWAPFLEFIAEETPEALADLADIVGNTVHAMGELWMAFDPVNDDFSQWLVRVTEDLDNWSAGLAQTQGFADFVEYIRETGPQVADTFGAIGSALLQITQAASPLGGPVLAGVEGLFRAVANIANSDIGTPLLTAVAAMGLLNRSMAVFAAAQRGAAGFGGRLTSAGAQASLFSTRLRQVRADLGLLATQAQVAGARTERELLRMNTASARLRANLTPIGRTGAVFGALAIAGTGAADGIGLTNTASLALAGSLAGPPGAVGLGLIGLMLDAKAAGREFGEAMQQADRAIETGGVDEMTEALKRLKREREDISGVSGFGDFFSDIGRNLGHPLETLGLKQGLGEQNDAKQAQLELNIEIERTQTAAEFSAAAIKAGFTPTNLGMDAATRSVKDLEEALVAVEEVLKGRSTFRGFQESIDDFADRQKTRFQKIKELEDARRRAADGGGLSANEQNRLNKLHGRVDSAKDAAARKRALGDLRAFEATIAEKTSAERERAREDIARLERELLDYKQTLDTTTVAGRANQELLDGIATSALNYAATLKDPVLKAAFLDNARDEFVKAAEAAGAGKQAAEDLATEVGLLDSVEGKVVITVDADGAIHIIDVVEERLRKLRQKALAAMPLTPLAGAMAGLLGDTSSTGFAAGGWTGPGAKYQPAGVVHADEFVFSKEATHGNVGLLNEMHRRLRGYADGGLVQPFASNVSHTYNSGLAIDYGRLASAVAANRGPGQLYGDVYMQPHNYNEFRRELDSDRRRNGLDGISRG